MQITQVTTNGCSWTFRNYSGSTGDGATTWQTTGTFGNYATASFSSSNDAGGGNWYTGSALGLDIVKEQIFSYGNTIDLKVDVTNYIKTWYTASLVDAAKGFPNNGFLVKTIKF